MSEYISQQSPREPVVLNVDPGGFKRGAPEPKVTARVVRVTPALAAKWLETNEGNRRLRQWKIPIYARVMKGGNWLLNGETLIFCEDGRLLNGQHRLWACLEAEADFDTVVVEGVSEEAFKTIDTGMGRTPGNILQMAGHDNASTLASAVRWAYAIANRKVTREGIGSTKITPGEVADLLGEYPGIDVSVGFICSKGHNSVTGRGGLQCALHYAFSVAAKYTLAVDTLAADNFFKDLQSGAGLAGDDPAHLLRERIIRERSGKARLRQGELYALYVRAWNARVRGLPKSCLRGWDKSPNATMPLIRGLHTEL